MHFRVESVLLVKDGLGRTVRTAAHCSSCMGEYTFSKERLLIENSYEFTPVFWTHGEVTVFSDPIYYLESRRRTASSTKEWPLNVWGTPQVHIDWTARNEEAIGSVALATNAMGGSLVEIYFPAKTINYSVNGDIRWQVCTGPIIVPSLDGTTIDLAFVCYTDAGLIEIIRRTAVVPISRRNPNLYSVLSLVPKIKNMLSVSAYSEIERVDGLARLSPFR